MFKSSCDDVNLVVVMNECRGYQRRGVEMICGQTV